MMMEKADAQMAQGLSTKSFGAEVLATGKGHTDYQVR